MTIILARICFLVSLFAATLIAPSSYSMGQETSSELFPEDSAAWLNSQPISSETLKNKAAILYFFEEG